MSRPVFLYLMQRGVRSWRFAASSRDVLALGSTWSASCISSSDTEMSGEAERDAVKVVLPLTDAFANDYVKNPPDSRTVVTIYKYDRDDSTYEYWWSGNVTTHEVSGGEVTLRCESDETLLAQAARPRIAMVPCPHALYVGNCRLDRYAFRQTVTLVSLVGAVATVSGHSGTTFAGGMIEASNGDTRKIVKQVGGVLTLARPLSGLSGSVGGSVYIYPGCARTPAACATFANAANQSGTNIENFGGFSWMLTGDRNPWGGSSAS